MIASFGAEGGQHNAIGPNLLSKLEPALLSPVPQAKTQQKKSHWFHCAPKHLGSHFSTDPTYTQQKARKGVLSQEPLQGHPCLRIISQELAIATFCWAGNKDNSCFSTMGPASHQDSMSYPGLALAITNSGSKNLGEVGTATK